MQTSVTAPISVLSDSLSPYLILLDSPPSLPICRACQAALLPRSIVDHLRKHHQLPIELRSCVKRLVDALPPLNFTDIPNNPDNSPPEPCLRIVSAFQCKHCSFIRRDVTDVRKHVNKEHKMSATDNYVEVRAQSWFGGRRAVYWSVDVTSTSMNEMRTETEKGEKEKNGDVAMQGINRTRTNHSVLNKFSGGNINGLCKWGFFGNGWGHRNPTSWRGNQVGIQGSETAKDDWNMFSLGGRAKQGWARIG